MKSLDTSEMAASLSVSLIALLAVTTSSAFSPKDLRTGALLIPEKIIGGVIDIVQSHKNKPLLGSQQNQGGNQGGQQSFQQNYQQNLQQYPQYQQWNGQSNQQGFQYQNQNQQINQNQQQNQGYNYQNGFNQGNLQGGYNNQVFPAQTAPIQQGHNYNQGHGVSQGQYQSNQNQFGQTNQFQNQQSSQYGQTQSNNQYQGNFQSQTGQVGHNEASGGILIPGNQHGSSQGQTCVCQAWTKPQSALQNDVPENTQKSESPKEL